MDEHDPRCMTLTSDEHPDVCDCRTLALVDSLARHEFIGVAGHPDDDECTYRSDGTDATYCGEPVAAHEPGGSTP